MFYIVWQSPNFSHLLRPFTPKKDEKATRDQRDGWSSSLPKNGKIISNNIHVHMHCQYIICIFLPTTNLLCISFQGPQQYVDELLDIHRKFSVLIKDTFRDDPAFISALDKVMICYFATFDMPIHWIMKI